ncbi:MAG TPA: hypothetical protein VGX69_12560 [Solirubrobacteraceae bacterium]|jgi:hypothetical protein|nr:hypothetical protein [Solirubrobacteraceae bacterium]
MATPVPLEAVEVTSYSELFSLPTAEVVRRLDARTEVPLHEGDAFLAVLVLRAVADLSDATKRLEMATYLLLVLTGVLVVLALVT